MRQTVIALLLAAVIVLSISIWIEISPYKLTLTPREQAVETIPAITIENTTASHNTYKINISERCISNNSVGEDWYICHSINGQIIRNGENFSVPFDTKTIDLLTEITEYDDQSDDSNSKKIILDLSNPNPIKTEITITEKDGPYDGNTATWEITVSVEKIN